MGKKNKGNKESKIENNKKILIESENQKELKKIKHKLEELNAEYNKKNKLLNDKKEENNRILKEKYDKFIFVDEKENELEVMKKKEEKKSNSNSNIFLENKDNNKKISIPKYKLPEVGILYEDNNKFYLVIEDYDELDKANEIAKNRYNNSKVVVEN
jgi:hypothetical protein